MASKDLIDTIIAEAGGEGEAGIIAATWAIAQRAAARGQTMDQVIRSGFDGYTNPGAASRRDQQNQQIRNQVQQIVQGVQRGTIPNPVPGADHFLSGNVMPSWARQMTPVATIGGHRFYASGNVPQSAQGIRLPPGELPQVATALDVRRPISPSTPTPLSPQLAAQRQVTAALNSGQLTAPTSAYANAYAATPRSSAENAIAQALSNGNLTRPSQSFNQSIYPQQPNLTRPGQINNSVNNALAGQDRGLANALSSYRSMPPSRDVAPRPVAAAIRADNGQTRPAPARRNSLPALPSRATDTSPRMTSAQTRADNGQARPVSAREIANAKGTTIATIPTTGVGAPPATRIVPSVPVNALNSPVNDIGGPLPSWQQFQRDFAKPVPGPASVAKDQSRLRPGVYPKAPVPASPAVATQLAVTAPKTVNVGLPTAASQRPLPQIARAPLPTPVAQRPVAPAMPIARPLPAPARPLPAPLEVVVYSNRLPAPAPLSVNNRYMMNGQAVQRGISNSLAGTSASGFGSDRYDSYSSGGSIAS